MSISYDSRTSDTEAKRPILASLFNALGWLQVLCTAFLVFAAVSSGEKIASIPVALVIGGTGGLVALASFGVAQILTIIARIEYHTSNEKNDAILRSLHKIEGHLAAIREKGKNA